MRWFRIVGRSITSGAKSVLRNFSLSMASISCTIITLILVSLGILLSFNVNNITKNIENELTIVILMNDETTTEEIKSLETEIRKVDNVNNITYKSKAEIKADIIKSGGSMGKIIEVYGDEALQDSFIVTVKKIEQINETATTIKNLNHVASVNYGESQINDLIKVFEVVKNSTIILVVALILVTTFLIGNTIKITIFSRRNEIEIMRLVGTNNFVIKMPFLIEGFLLGAIGSVIPIILTIFGYTYIYETASTMSFSNMLNVISLIKPSSIIYLTSLVLLAVGSIVGMLGSVRAVRKFLKI